MSTIFVSCFRCDGSGVGERRHRPFWDDPEFCEELPCAGCGGTGENEVPCEAAPEGWE